MEKEEDIITLEDRILCDSLSLMFLFCSYESEVSCVANCNRKLVSLWYLRYRCATWYLLQEVPGKTTMWMKVVLVLIARGMGVSGKGAKESQLCKFFMSKKRNYEVNWLFNTYMLLLLPSL